MSASNIIPWHPDEYHTALPQSSHCGYRYGGRHDHFSGWNGFKMKNSTRTRRCRIALSKIALYLEMAWNSLGLNKWISSYASSVFFYDPVVLVHIFIGGKWIWAYCLFSKISTKLSLFDYWGTLSKPRQKWRCFPHQAMILCAFRQHAGHKGTVLCCHLLCDREAGQISLFHRLLP